MFTTTANTVCRCHDQFAAGRAVVKPACRFRQARGLRRRSEYGSSVQSHHPAGIQNSGGVMFLFNPAGSVSELKLLGIQCEDRPAFFAGRSFLIPSSRDTSFLPTQTSIPIPRPLLPVDRFPSFIVIASPSVITTTLTSPDYRLELGIGRPGWRADLMKHFWMAGPGGWIYDSFFQEITHFS